MGLYDTYYVKIDNSKSINNYVYYLKVICNRFIYFVLLIANIILMNCSLNRNSTYYFLNNTIYTFIKPYYLVVDYSTKCLSDVFYLFKDMSFLFSYNRKLLDETKRLNLRLIHMGKLLQENKELRTLLNYVQSEEVYKYITLKPVFVSNNKFVNKLKLNFKNIDVIHEGDLVFDTLGYFIGRVINVLGSNAEVLLISDPNSKIPVVTKNSQSKFILIGNNTNTLDILYKMDNKAVLEEGDLVFTLDNGDILHKDLYIGKIVKQNNTFKVQLDYDIFKNIDTVLIKSRVQQ